MTPLLMPWGNGTGKYFGYLASIDMVKHIPTSEEREGAVNRFSDEERTINHPEYKVS